MNKNSNADQHDHLDIGNVIADAVEHAKEQQHLRAHTLPTHIVVDGKQLPVKGSGGVSTITINTPTDDVVAALTEGTLFQFVMGKRTDVAGKGVDVQARVIEVYSRRKASTGKVAVGWITAEVVA